MATVIIAAMAVLLWSQGSVLLRQHFKNQVRMAAGLLAADLRQLQQEALYRSVSGRVTLYAQANGEGYSFRENNLVEGKVTFAKQGCNDVYFSSVVASVGFNANGSPSATGTYVLRHHKLASFCCKVAVQPVTGRVAVDEEE